jgi:hypothetical protein
MAKMYDHQTLIIAVMSIAELLNRLLAGLRLCLGWNRARPFILGCAIG